MIFLKSIMKDNYMSEFIIGVILMIFLVLVVNPFQVWMPDTLHMMLIVGFAIMSFVFAGIIFKEKSKDERELVHRNTAGRFGYLVGVITLVAGIIVQGLKHSLDPWLVFALSMMILAKIISRIYSQSKN